MAILFEPVSEGKEYKEFIHSQNIQDFNTAYNIAHEYIRLGRMSDAKRELNKCKPALVKLRKEANALEKEKDKKAGIRFVDILDGLVADGLNDVNKKTTKESAFLEEKAMEFLRENYADMISEKDFSISVYEIDE